MADHDTAGKIKPHGDHGSSGSHGGGHGAGGGHEDHEEHEGAPEWLISFADNVALLMGFFVIMLAMNMAQKAASNSDSESTGEPRTPTTQELDWVLSVREGFNNPVSIHSKKPGEQSLVNRLREKMRASGRDDGPQGKHEESQSLQRGSRHGPVSVLLFAEGSSELTPDTVRQLEQFSDYVRGLKVITELRAHASLAESYDSNDRGMQLAFDRARNAARKLASLGVDWRQMRLTPCGANEPTHAVRNDTDEVVNNARVEIIVTEDLPQ